MGRSTDFPLTTAVALNIEQILGLRIPRVSDLDCGTDYSKDDAKHISTENGCQVRCGHGRKIVSTAGHLASLWRVYPVGACGELPFRDMSGRASVPA